MKCQVAYWAVNRPSPIAETTSARSVRRRSSHQTASHMKTGKSTATNRGSDISGWGSTGKLSGRAKAATT